MNCSVPDNVYHNTSIQQCIPGTNASTMNITHNSAYHPWTRLLNMTTQPPEAAIEIFDVPTGIIALLSICYGSVSLMAVAGNFCVLWIVASRRRMQTVTNYFIANLAFADIMIGLFSVPFQFQAALLQKWLLPPFMCAFCPFVQVLSVNVSIFTLTAISLDRYRAVMYPLKARTTKLSAKVVIIGIWAFGALAGIPYGLALKVTMAYDPLTSNFTRPFCTNTDVAPHLWKTYNYILVSLQYFVPLFVISFAYGKMGLKLKEAQAPGNAQSVRDESILKNKKKVSQNETACEYHVKNKSEAVKQVSAYSINADGLSPVVIKMLFIVVALFAFCWLPFQTYNLLQEIFPQINEYKYINVIWFCAHWLAMSNSCYNPFIYAIYNERFKKEFKNKCDCQSRKRRRPDYLYDMDSNTVVMSLRSSFHTRRKSVMEMHGNSLI